MTLGHAWPIIPSEMIPGETQTCARCGVTVSMNADGSRHYVYPMRRVAVRVEDA
jgi:hypothetical protein